MIQQDIKTLRTAILRALGKAATVTATPITTGTDTEELEI